MQRVESCDDSSTSGEETFNTLGFDSARHVKTGSSLKSDDNGLFQSPKNTDLIKMKQHVTYKDLTALDVDLIQTMNE